jgi:hypothetical protein
MSNAERVSRGAFNKRGGSAVGRKTRPMTAKVNRAGL